MTTRKMEEKCEELKYYFNAKMSKQEKNLTKVLINKFKMKLKAPASIGI